jgi:hypothetical protein
MKLEKCPTCGCTLLTKTKYCSSCAWFEDEEGKIQYEKDKKESIEEIYKKGANFSIESINSDTEILHFIPDKWVDNIDEKYNKYLETELFNIKFIRMHCVYIGTKKADSFTGIISFKANNNELYFDTISFKKYPNQTLIHTPYFAIGKDISEHPIVVYPVNYYSGYSEYLINEMQYYPSGRLHLYTLYKEGKIKKPNYFLK